MDDSISQKLAQARAIQKRIAKSEVKRQRLVRILEHVHLGKSLFKDEHSLSFSVSVKSSSCAPLTGTCSQPFLSCSLTNRTPSALTGWTVEFSLESLAQPSLLNYMTSSSTYDTESNEVHEDAQTKSDEAKRFDGKSLLTDVQVCHLTSLEPGKSVSVGFLGDALPSSSSVPPVCLPATARLSLMYSYEWKDIAGHDVLGRASRHSAEDNIDSDGDSEGEDTDDGEESSALFFQRFHPCSHVVTIYNYMVKDPMKVKVEDQLTFNVTVRFPAPVNKDDDPKSTLSFLLPWLCQTDRDRVLLLTMMSGQGQKLYIRERHDDQPMIDSTDLPGHGGRSSLLDEVELEFRASDSVVLRTAVSHMVELWKPLVKDTSESLSEKAYQRKVETLLSTLNDGGDDPLTMMQAYADLVLQPANLTSRHHHNTMPTTKATSSSTRETAATGKPEHSQQITIGHRKTSSSTENSIVIENVEGARKDRIDSVSYSPLLQRRPEAGSPAVLESEESEDGAKAVDDKQGKVSDCVMVPDESDSESW